MRGLVDAALEAQVFRELTELAGQRPVELALVGPVSAQLFVACALARVGPLLVVTATGREADDLTAELRGVHGDAAALFPSWETLPHERLSPGVDTVGARMMLLRRLAHPDDAELGPPLTAADLAEVEPVTLRVGAESSFDDLPARLVELAYTRVDMVGRRGEFAVRGGILDVFAPTAEHPVRVEFWGDEITEIRMFSVADQRSIPEIEVGAVIAVACRELLLTDEVRTRAAELAADAPTDDEHITGRVGDMLAKLAEGIPVDGLEALAPVLHPERRRRPDRHRGTRRLGIPRSRRGAGAGTQRRPSLVDDQPARRARRDGSRGARRAVGPGPAEWRRRDFRDVARPCAHRWPGRRRRPGYRNRTPGGRATR